MKTLDARTLIGTGFPPEEGARLAKALLEMQGLNWEETTVDLSQCPAGLLISAFFNSFLQTVYEEDSDRLEQARALNWKLAHQFQRDNVTNWMHDFAPVAA